MVIYCILNPSNLRGYPMIVSQTNLYDENVTGETVFGTMTLPKSDVSPLNKAIGDFALILNKSAGRIVDKTTKNGIPYLRIRLKLHKNLEEPVTNVRFILKNMMIFIKKGVTKTGIDLAGSPAYILEDTGEMSVCAQTFSQNHKIELHKTQDFKRLYRKEKLIIPAKSMRVIDGDFKGYPDAEYRSSSNNGYITVRMFDNLQSLDIMYVKFNLNSPEKTSRNSNKSNKLFKSSNDHSIKSSQSRWTGSSLTKSSVATSVASASFKRDFKNIFKKMKSKKDEQTEIMIKFMIALSMNTDAVKVSEHYKNIKRYVKDHYENNDLPVDLNLWKIIIAAYLYVQLNQFGNEDASPYNFENCGEPNYTSPNFVTCTLYLLFDQAKNQNDINECIQKEAKSIAKYFAVQLNTETISMKKYRAFSSKFFKDYGKKKQHRILSAVKKPNYIKLDKGIIKQKIKDIPKPFRKYVYSPAVKKILEGIEALIASLYKESEKKHSVSSRALIEHKIRLLGMMEPRIVLFPVYVDTTRISNLSEKIKENSTSNKTIENELDQLEYDYYLYYLSLLKLTKEEATNRLLAKYDTETIQKLKNFYNAYKNALDDDILSKGPEYVASDDYLARAYALTKYIEFPNYQVRDIEKYTKLLAEYQNSPDKYQLKINKITRLLEAYELYLSV